MVSLVNCGQKMPFEVFIRAGGYFLPINNFNSLSDFAHTDFNALFCLTHAEVKGH